eukprot:TRINITY_DN5666_c0_g2_i1.p2 TRINITY_DN5666_c0_g2~~TRINITY_DN5666_c0_g2_i1.p2  ORF type:complete len:100 (+),score=29.98 TRINITY_DN5666_c0_g2_i1:854-1153(+)
MCPSQNCTVDIALKLGCWDLFDGGAFWINCNANLNVEEGFSEYDEPVPAQKGFNTNILNAIRSNNPIVNKVKSFIEKVKTRAVNNPPVLVKKEVFTPLY